MYVSLSSWARPYHVNRCYVIAANFGAEAPVNWTLCDKNPSHLVGARGAWGSALLRDPSDFISDEPDLADTRIRTV